MFTMTMAGGLYGMLTQSFLTAEMAIINENQGMPCMRFFLMVAFISCMAGKPEGVYTFVSVRQYFVIINKCTGYFDKQSDKS